MLYVISFAPSASPTFAHDTQLVTYDHNKLNSLSTGFSTTLCVIMHVQAGGPFLLQGKLMFGSRCNYSSRQTDDDLVDKTMSDVRCINVQGFEGMPIGFT